MYNVLLAETKASFPAHLPTLTDHLKKLDGLPAAQRAQVGLACWVANLSVC